VIVQLDEHTNARGQYLGKTLSLGPGLSLILPASDFFRRPRQTKELTEICAKCSRRLRTWGMRRLATDHTSPRIAFIECDCLLIGFEIDKHDLRKIVSAWSSLRRLQDRALSEFKRTEPEGN
jgi:hypothetical protein